MKLSSEDIELLENIEGRAGFYSSHPDAPGVRRLSKMGLIRAEGALGLSPICAFRITPAGRAALAEAEGANCK